MADPIVTLTTDFGDASPYVAALKGALLSVNPAARLVDLSHAIAPQDLRHAAFFLAAAVPWFPPGTLHVVVVDPGVGTARAMLYVEVRGQRLLAPDNGCWTLLDAPSRVFRLAEPRFWAPTVSHTFHGRDILAPVAGRLSLGLDPAQLGPPVSSWVRCPWPEPCREGGVIRGEIVFVDTFGNLISNIPAAGLGQPRVVRVGDTRLPGPLPWVRSYGQAAAGELVALASSNGFVEVAVVEGNAARRLGAAVGTPVELHVDVNSP